MPPVRFVAQRTTYARRCGSVALFPGNLPLLYDASDLDIVTKISPFVCPAAAASRVSCAAVRRTLLVLFLIATPVVAGERRRSVAFPHSFPSCTVVTGTPAVTFTRNWGQTLAPVAERLEGVGYTYGLAA